MKPAKRGAGRQRLLGLCGPWPLELAPYKPIKVNIPVTTAPPAMAPTNSIAKLSMGKEIHNGRYPPVSFPDQHATAASIHSVFYHVYS